MPTPRPFRQLGRWLGKFLHTLSYKAERAGRAVVKVNPRGLQENTGHGEIDRDHNALNVLGRGLVGLGWPEPTPVEIEPLLSVPASGCYRWASSVVEAGSRRSLTGVVYKVWCAKKC